MNRTKFIWCVVALGMVAAAPAAAQQPPPDSILVLLRDLQRRLDSLEQVVAELRAADRDTSGPADELAALRAAAQAAAGAPEAQPDTAAGGSRTRNLQVLNPEISVTGDIVGSFQAPAGERNRTTVVPREFEFSFQAALDPYTRTKIFVTREEDFRIAGLPEEAGEEESPGFEIEEGYMYWVGLPGGFGARVGKFRQEIGLYNRWHSHALLEIDRPLATTTFLGEDGLIQTGLGISLPSLSIGPTTQTATFEAAAGSNDALFAGGGDITYLGRLQSFWDLGASYFQVGATGVLGGNDEIDLDTKLLGLDASFRWTPRGQALYRDLQLKAEWYFTEQTIATDELAGDGGYFQANFRASRRWILGTRADFVNGFEDTPDVFQLVPSLSWWQSEWVRIRLQYHYLKPVGIQGSHTLLLQTVWAIGPHKHESY